MEKYLKRTKMMDEAKNQSKPKKPVSEMLIFLLIYYIGNFIQSIFLYPVIMVYFINTGFMNEITGAVLGGQQNAFDILGKMLADLPEWIIIVGLISSYAVALTAIIYCRCFEKRSIQSIGFRRQCALKEYSLGAFDGAVLFTGVILIGFIIGAYKFSGFGNVNIWFIPLHLIGYIIYGASEVVLLYGYFMTSMTRSTSTYYALIVSSLMYVFLHWGGINASFISFVNLLLYALIIGIYVIKRGNIWGACAMHSLWNFMQGSIFGVNTNKNAVSSCVLSFVTKDNVESITGGLLGVEGGLICTLVLFMALGIVWIVEPNNDELSDIYSDSFKGNGEADENI